MPSRHVGGVHITKSKLIIAALVIATPAFAEPPYLIKPTYNYGAPEPYRLPREYSAKEVEGLRELEFLPPAEFDHEYTGILTIVRTTEAGVRAKCPHVPTYHAALGCAVRMLDGSTCTMYIANDLTLQANGWSYEMVLRHERGHCNGWRHAKRD